MRVSNTNVAGGGPNDFLTVRHLRIEGANRDIGPSPRRGRSGSHGAAAGPTPGAGPDPAAGPTALVRPAPPDPGRTWQGNRRCLCRRLRQRPVGRVWLATYDSPPAARWSSTRAKAPKTATGSSRETSTSHRHIHPDRRAPGGRRAAPSPLTRGSSKLRPDDGYASVVIGIMDVMGAMDGINEAGLAVALLADNESSNPEPTGGPQVGLAGTADRPLPARHLRHRRRSQRSTPAREAVLLLRTLPLRGGRPYGTIVRVGVLPGHNRGNHRRRLRGRGPNDLHQTTSCTAGPIPRTSPRRTGHLGTAALTYTRWKTLHAAASAGTVVDRDDIRDQFEAVRFAAPVEGARTFWHAFYDVEDRSVEVAFYLHRRRQPKHLQRSTHHHPQLNPGTDLGDRAVRAGSGAARRRLQRRAHRPRS